MPYLKSGWKSRYTCNATIQVFNTLQGLDLKMFLFARRYWGNHYCFIFLEVIRCFSSLGLLFHTYVFSMELCDITRIGLPHSEIPGSKVASTYPRLIAGNHVLHRLPVPRHPPCALSNLTKKSLSIQIESLITLTARAAKWQAKASINLFIYGKTYIVKRTTIYHASLKPAGLSRNKRNESFYSFCETVLIVIRTIEKQKRNSKH